VKIDGRFELIRKLGEGGMGEVYLASDTFTNEQVAIKLTHLGSKNIDLLKKRFIREVKLLQSINHNGVVKLISSGETVDRLYCVMEFIPGEQICAGKTYKDTAMLLIKVADALEAIHNHGVVHRDIKPENILMNGDNPIIVDFGIASESTNTRLTQTGSMIGTVSYMSPEQVMGSQVDHRADLYSLGVVMYELLTKQSPFVGGQVANQIFKILQERPILPTQINPDIPQSLETICIKLLEKNPEQRYQNAAELVTDLTTFVRGEQVHGRKLADISQLAIPFVGREDIAERLGEILDLLFFNDGHFVIIKGPEGSGKSRMVEQLRSLALLRSFRVLVCDPKLVGEGVPAIASTLDALANFNPIEDKAFLQKHAGLINSLSPKLAEKWEIPKPIKDESESDPSHVLVDLMLLAVPDKSKVLIFESDLDDLSKSVLLALAEKTKGRDMLVVALTAMPTPTLINIEPIILQLKPMTLSNIIEIATSFNLSLEDEKAKDLLSKSSGNARYIIEAIRRLASEKKTTSGLPESLESIIQKSILHLSETSQVLLKKAAIIKKPLPIDDLQAIVRLPETVMKDSIAELIRDGLLAERLGGNMLVLEIASEPVFKSVMNMLTNKEVTSYHKDVAQSLELISVGTTKDYNAEVGRHYFKAGDIDKGAIFMLKAIDNAQKEKQYFLSKTIIDELYASFDTIYDNRIKSEFLIKFFNQFLFFGSVKNLDKAISDMEKHLEWEKVPKDMLFQAVSTLGWVKSKISDFANAKKLLDHASKLADESKNPENIFQINSLQNSFSIETCNYKEALKFAQKMSDLSKKSADDKKNLIALNAIGLANSYLGSSDNAVRAFEEVLSKSEFYSQEMPNTFISTRINMAQTLYKEKRYDEAIELLIKARDQASNEKNSAQTIISTMSLIELGYATGRIDLIGSSIDNARKFLMMVGKSIFTYNILVAEFNLSMLANNQKDMALKADELEAFSREQGNNLWLAHALYLKGLILFIDSKYVEAIEKFKETLELTSPHKDQSAELFTLTNHRIAHIYAYLGNFDKARQHLKWRSQLSSKITSVDIIGQLDVCEAWVDYFESKTGKSGISILQTKADNFNLGIWKKAYSAFTKIISPLTATNTVYFFRFEAIFGFGRLVLDRKKNDMHLSDHDKDCIKEAKRYIDEVLNIYNDTGFSFLKSYLIKIRLEL
jgi:tetratricopeptide (TPR) repeat protein